jgi:hypothetical protein
MHGCFVTISIRVLGVRAAHGIGSVSELIDAYLSHESVSDR